jgi:hypothetical protein
MNKIRLGVCLAIGGLINLAGFIVCLADDAFVAAAFCAFAASAAFAISFWLLRKGKKPNSN